MRERKSCFLRKFLFFLWLKMNYLVAKDTSFHLFFFLCFPSFNKQIAQSEAVIADSCLMFCISKCYYFAQWKLKATLLKLLPDTKSLFLWLSGTVCFPQNLILRRNFKKYKWARAPQEKENIMKWLLYNIWKSSKSKPEYSCSTKKN